MRIDETVVVRKLRRNAQTLEVVFRLDEWLPYSSHIAHTLFLVCQASQNTERQNATFKFARHELMMPVCGARKIVGQY
jgi:hypothetical protein